ncbi:MAG: hypothetical protein JXQ30_13365 [Spirochaetes bacterium]|nr:hypothetical protein [Spirochaetota bacterium]
MKKASYTLLQKKFIAGIAAVFMLSMLALAFFVSCGAGVDVSGINNYTLTVLNDGNGTTNPAGTITVTHGVPESIIATPTDGYGFDTWIVKSGTAVFADAGSASTTVTLSNGAATIEAKFSLLDYIEITNPSSTSVLGPGEDVTIEWGASSFEGLVNLSLYKGGVEQETIHSNAPNTGTYDWTVPDPIDAANDYSIYIETTGIPSQSDMSDTFSIGGIALVSPNGGELYGNGDICTIEWNASSVTGVKIELLEGGEPSKTIAAEAPETGSYSWNITATDWSTDYAIRITDVSRPSITDTSDASFQIGHVSITSPSAGESLTLDESVPITWDSDGHGYLTMDILLDGEVFHSIPSTNNDGSHSIDVGYYEGHDGDSYQVRLTSTSDTSITAETGEFTLVRGTYVWTKKFPSDVSPSVITTDSTGNVYIGGYFMDFGTPVNFAADWGEEDYKSSYTATDYDPFVTKINSDGTYGWTRVFNFPEHNYIYDIAIGTLSDDLFINGGFEGTNVNFAADWGGSDVKSSAGGTDVFITRINEDGSYGWTRVVGGPDDETGGSMEVDQGYIFLCGRYKGTVNFKTDWGGTEEKTSSSPHADLFVMRFGKDGTWGSWDWVHVINDDDTISGTMIIDYDAVCITGTFYGTVDFKADWGSSDIKTTSSSSGCGYITHLDRYGGYEWTKRIGTGATHPAALANYGYSIFVLGTYSDTVNFKDDFGGTDELSVADDSSYDIFVMEIDTVQNYYWTHRFGGTYEDSPTGGVVENQGSLYFSGIFSNSPYYEPVNYGEDFDEDNPKKTNGNDRDIFLSALYIHSDPEYLFTKRIGCPSSDYVTGIAVYEDDDEYGRRRVNIYLLGSSSDSPYNMAEDWKQTDEKGDGYGFSFVTKVLQHRWE